ncbi:MAG TPA: tRNA lysidine(34) synthetase TilS [Verrucomicrobiae bacterium]|nr:tRNA lysidine(34) synthetase TilS [Verrucomicrobiae bacterium]
MLCVWRLPGKVKIIYDCSDMQDLQHRFAAALDALRPGPTLVVGVSGGMDSMALLELLQVGGKKLIVAHFNHQLRGAESDGDEAFVQEQAEKRDLEFRVGRGDVRAEAKGISIEMAARKLRHAFLAEVAREVGGDIVLAHHADDQIETVLMRIGRGVQGYGASGIRRKAVSSADPSVRILRPLLELRKSELKDFVKERNIPFREDSSNTQLDAERNRIRHAIVPMLRERFGAEFESLLLEKASGIREADESVRQAAREWSDGDFFALPDRLKSEIILIQLHRARLPVNKRIIGSLLKEPNCPVMIRPGQTATLSARGKIQINDPVTLALPVIVRLTEDEENRIDFGGGIFTWSFSSRKNLDASTDVMMFDAAKVGPDIMLRHPKAGDRVRLSGRGSARPLMEVLNKNKIPREKRRHLVLGHSFEAGEIFWVEGLRITENFKITESTKTALVWKWRRE